MVKALALGADFVWVGRPMLYAAVIGGEAGVTKAIGILKRELHRDIGLLGLMSPSEVSAAHLETPA